MTIRSIDELLIYTLAEDFAMNIFKVTKDFPREERYSLTDQIRRSSRSIAVNIAEGWGLRAYAGLFKKHLIYSMGSLEETRSWLNFSFKCNYISKPVFDDHQLKLDEIAAKLYLFTKNLRQ